MKFLIIGLGSMGKRRIRCLQSLGYTDIYGFDLREDRRNEAMEKYKITTFKDIDKGVEKVNPDALIISVPPDIHSFYMKLAIKKKINFFVEVSVVDTDFDEIISSLKNSKIVGVPSATLVFHPAIQMVKNIIKSDELGKISNVILHSGQYLPDWHTYEKVSDFYVSNPVTGGAREIVPFELTWLTHIFGFPSKVSGNVRKTIEIKGAEKIDDTYNFLLDYNNFLITVTVDVVSRFAVRRLLINGDKKQLLWDWNNKIVKIYNPDLNQWEERSYQMKRAETGYNPNIGENMYIDELKAFIESFKTGKKFVNNLKDDHKVLKLLYAIEQSDKQSRHLEY